MRGAAAVAMGLCLLACNGSAPETITVGPGSIVISLPKQMGQLERPAVLFDHGKHSAALAEKGCETCHKKDTSGRLVGRYGRLTDPKQREALVQLYHDGCIGCHDRREKAKQSSGPVTCGECHRRRGEVKHDAVAIHFDYSLHARHEEAVKPCGECHHVYDEAAGKLVPGKGQEQGCVACHGERAKGRTLSLKDAAHRSCISCHLVRASSKRPSGPTGCKGCHAREQQLKFKRLDGAVHPQRKQKATLLMATAGAKTPPVRFDHLGHEAQAPFCSTCHHRGLADCASCHPLSGDAPKGGGINLEDANHKPDSVHSCIGCHRRQSLQQDCAGCHGQLVRGETQRSCTVCHQGETVPAGEPAATPASREGEAPASQPSSQPAAPAAAGLAAAPLPATSEAFPEVVEIKTLSRKYRPSRLPHKKIVEHLHRAASKSKLALRFHGGNDALCGGCHHRSPLGQRPPTCRSCHGAKGEATDDKPNLFNAYHRQCIGCHQRMGLKTDCVTCHPKAEGQP